MKGSGAAEVSFLLRRLEPRLAWAVAACAGWAVALLAPTEMALWALALYAAAIGLWCRRFPAHRQWLMFVRATLLLEGAFVMQLAPAAGGPTGPFFIGVVMVVAAYSLALSRPWAAALAILALLQFGAGCLLVPEIDLRLALAQAGVLGFFAVVAALFGGALRELDAQAEQARRDRSSQLYNEQGFFNHGAELFEECRRLRRPFSLVLLNASDLHEVSDLVGRNASNQLFARLVAELSAATPRDGIAARMDASEFVLALPGLAAERARVLLRQHLGEPPRIALSCRGDLVTVMLDVLVAEATPDIASLEDFYERLHAQVLKRFGVELPIMPDKSSTLEKLLDDDPPIPHHARPTLPMGLRPTPPRRA
jgi:GGDEF domain-containing protein